MKRVTNSNQFANVAVYQDGDSYYIKFRNAEIKNQSINAAIAAALVLGAPVIMGLGYQLGDKLGIMHWWGFWVWVAVVVLAVLWCRPGRKVDRMIEIDHGKQRIRVFKNNFEEIDYPLAELDNLTIDEHPQAQVSRHKNPGKIGAYQKTHCLYGWFGEGGNEKLELVNRYEWPINGSLREVGEAIKWAIERGAPSSRRERATSRDARTSGIKPPLD